MNTIISVGELNSTAVQIIQTAPNKRSSGKVLDHTGHRVNQETEEEVHELRFAFSEHDFLFVPVVEHLDAKLW
jgi:hypothetical protein